MSDSEEEQGVSASSLKASLDRKYAAPKQPEYLTLATELFGKIKAMGKLTTDTPGTYMEIMDNTDPRVNQSERSANAWNGWIFQITRPLDIVHDWYRSIDHVLFTKPKIITVKELIDVGFMPYKNGQASKERLQFRFDGPSSGNHILAEKIFRKANAALDTYMLFQSPPTSPPTSPPHEEQEQQAEVPVQPTFMPELVEDIINNALATASTEGRQAGANMVVQYPDVQRAILALPDSILQAIRGELTLAGNTRGIADRTAPDFTDRANLLKEISRTDPMLAETIKSRALGDVISGRVSVDQYQDITGLLQPSMQGNIVIDPRKQAVKGRISYADIPRWI